MGVHGMLDDLAERRAQNHHLAFAAAEGAALVVRWTGALGRELFMILEDALSCGKGLGGFPEAHGCTPEPS